MEEQWKKIPRYRDYSVSNYGRVESRRGSQPRILKPAPDGGGYMAVVLCNAGGRRTARIHRLVAELFIPNPKNKPCVNHKDLRRTNNSVLNLEWCTDEENRAHADANGHRPGRPRKHPELDFSVKRPRGRPAKQGKQYELSL